MRKILTLLMTLMLAGWSLNAWSFDCKTNDGAGIGTSGRVNVYVDLSPTIGTGENLVVDLSSQISCHNLIPSFFRDDVSMAQGSAYSGLLSNFTGTLKYESSRYPFPLTSETHKVAFTSTSYSPWPVTLYLTPVSSAGGVVISAGSLIAVLVLQQYSNGKFASTITWNVYAKNNVVVPTGSCDVSARNVTVTLPDYPGSVAVPVSVHCSKNQNLGYYISGTTADSANSIFTNTASASPAGGIGVQLKRNGSVLSTNSTVSLGTVGTSAVNLGLTATYARTTGQVTAGNVQSIIGVTFVYQ